jgi:hypothetical protein
MKDKIEKPQKLTMLFQMESCKINYHLDSKDSRYNSLIYDSICVECRTILSDYKSIKVDDLVELIFIVEPAFMDENCRPTALGGFEKENKKYCGRIFVPPSFPDRFDFILNRGLKPYFYLSCEKSKYEKPDVKSLSMKSEIILEDYIPV